MRDVSPKRHKVGAPGVRGATLISLLSLSLGACATQSADPARRSDLMESRPAASPAARVAVDSRKLASQGLVWLAKRDDDRALQMFNAAIKFDSENAAYHFLAGTAYHLKFLAGGSPEMQDDAEIGYRLAARFAPLEPMPWVQLGRLYLDARDEVRARDAFARAVALQPANLDALRGLASASYLTGDIVTALWCADEMERRGAEAAELNRYRAVFRLALGDRQHADRYRMAYFADGSTTALARASLEEGMTRIGGMIDSRDWTVAPTSSAPATYLAPPPAPPAPSPPRAGPASGTGAGPIASPWWNCAGAPAGSPLPSTAGPSGPRNPEETQPLPALPPSCAGSPPPRVAMIDVVLLATNDEVDRSYGLNLLQGLTGYFGYAANFTKTGDAPTQKVKSTLFGVGAASGGPSAPLSYSLNIANSALTHDDIIARPTLIAVDRMPSTFFSGEAVSISVGGGAGSISSLNDRHVGMGVAITPTFLDDDHVLLAVKIDQSAVEEPWVQTTGVNLQQSRNMASASLVATFGETVILSGLTQRERSRTESGVPVLRNIPGLQYLFSTETPVDAYKTTMMLLTVRKPEGVTDPSQGARDRPTGRAPGYAFDWRIKAYEQQVASETPGLESALARLTTEEMFRGFKGSDLGDSRWDAPTSLTILAHSALEMLSH